MERKQTVDLNAAFSPGHDMTNGEMISHCLGLLVKQCHAASYNRGWWHDPITGLSLIPGAKGIDGLKGLETLAPASDIIKAWFPYVIATKISLIHSEISEGLEAYRVDDMDDKIPFPGITAEMGDAVIRIADLMGCLREYARITGEAYNDAYNLGAAILAKLPVNGSRPDHDLAKRAQPGGKKF